MVQGVNVQTQYQVVGVELHLHGVRNNSWAQNRLR